MKVSIFWSFVLIEDILGKAFIVIFVLEQMMKCHPKTSPYVRSSYVGKRGETANVLNCPVISHVRIVFLTIHLVLNLILVQASSFTKATKAIML